MIFKTYKFDTIDKFNKKYFGILCELLIEKINQN